MSTSADLIKHILKRLMELGAIRIDTRPGGGFRVKIHETQPDAPLSPIYISLRTPENKGGTLTPDVLADMAEVMWMRASGTYFDGVVGLPHAGDPIAKAFCKVAGRELGRTIPLLRLSKEEKPGKRRIGAITEMAGLSKGASILAIDDLLTKGGTKDEALGSLEEHGFEVKYTLIFLDREQGGMAYLARKGISLLSVVGIRSVLEFYADQEMISKGDYETITSYLRENS